jgi:glycosyltransferase involved in cell wall biosynthesis
MAVYPRVLVVNAGPFNRRFNHGIVMSNFFEGWPQDRLATVGFTQNLRPDFDVCSRYWLVTRSSVVKGLLGKAPSGMVPAPTSAEERVARSHAGGEMDRRTPYERLARTLTSAALRVPLNEVFYRLPTVLSAPLRRWIADFHADVVFSMLGSGTLVRVNVKISQSRGIPCVPYFTDDWISWMYSEDWSSWWLRPSLHYWFRNYLQRSPLRLTCSTAMAEEYARRYGGAFQPCFACADADDSPAFAGPREESPVLRLAFIGTLAPDRWRSLREIGEALLGLYAEGLHAELLVYTPPSDIEAFGKYLTREPVLRIAGTARPAEVPRLQRAADVLVHVESFDRHSVRKTRFSMSTKIPQYLMAGRCIFAYGPGELASMRYLAETGAGLTVGERNPQMLRSALREVITSQGMRSRLARRARSVGMENHEASGQRERLRMLLAEACEQWRARARLSACAEGC